MDPARLCNCRDGLRRIVQSWRIVGGVGDQEPNRQRRRDGNYDKGGDCHDDVDPDRETAGAVF